MTSSFSRLISGTALVLLASLPAAYAQQADDEIVLDEVVLTAEEQIKQSLGVSQITADDISKQPVTNDISEIVRKMPGVNLTGNSASGQRGNQRQIDIRGMGPENTLILIDGKPVNSRNAVRMGRGGERDTRGDSNWVPAEMIERIEVLRGPAASRYGSGSAGGVVNIITKRPDTQTANVSMYLSQPKSDQEGAARRLNMMVATPLGKELSLRFNANYSKVDGDDADINDLGKLCNEGSTQAPNWQPCDPAGREGVINKDIGTLLSWSPNDAHRFDLEFNFSRQGNIYAGDRQLSTSNDIVRDMVGQETNTMYRRNWALTHRGNYDFGNSFSYIQWENTFNSRLGEATAGGPEGSFNTTDRKNIKLSNITAKTEWTLPFALAGKNQVLTLGAEARREEKKDFASLGQTLANGNVTLPGVNDDPADRNPRMTQTIISLYAESNIVWNDQLTLTPALRFDHSSKFGSNLSPSLNVTYQINSEWTVKGGVARAFKAPNLFQLDPEYVYYTRGNGCPLPYSNNGVGCYVLGNPNLEAETSINKEIGIAYDGVNGITGSLTYFHNDYKNRISSGRDRYTSADPTNDQGHVFRWENNPKAVISGFEGNINIPFADQFTFNTNFTYMTQSKDKSTGQPLSLVPKYTVNAALTWDATEQLSVTASATHYGKIDPLTASASTGGAITDPTALESRPSYTIANLGFTYDYNDSTRITGGVTNLFDKTLLRTGNGANTFNEPGRAFYVSLNKSF